MEEDTLGTQCLGLGFGSGPFLLQLFGQHIESTKACRSFTVIRFIVNYQLSLRVHERVLGSDHTLVKLHVNNFCVFIEDPDGRRCQALNARPQRADIALVTVAVDLKWIVSKFHTHCMVFGGVGRNTPGRARFAL